MPGWMKPSKQATGDLDSSAKGKAEAKAMSRRFSETEKNTIRGNMKRRFEQKVQELNAPKDKPSARYSPKIIEKGVRP